MSSVEPARHALYSRLEDVLGSEYADTLMTCLPQNRSEEVATKTDIDRLESRFDRMEDRFDRMEDRLDRHQRFFVVTTFGTLTAMTAVFSVVVVFLS